MALNLKQVLQLILPGLATGFGAVPIFFIKNPSQKFIDILLSVAAGIMLAATFFALILPAGDIWPAKISEA